jgi:hypothetical protein
VYGVFSQGVAVNQDVVEISHKKIIEEGSQDVVDKMLERSGGVGESERHNKRFKKAIAGAEGRLPFFTFSHANQVVGMPDVKSGVVAGFGKVVQGFSYQGFSYQGKRISILDSSIIEAKVNDTKT